MAYLVFARQSAKSLDLEEFSGERLVNMFVQAWPDGGVAPAVIRQPFGHTSFVDLGTNSPVRAMIENEGTLYAVSGGSLFSITSAGVATNRGTVADSVKTTMADNDAGHIAIAANDTYYVWNGSALSTPTMNALTGCQMVTYMDGFTILVDTATDRLQSSGLSDATSLDASDFSAEDTDPDLLVGAYAYGSYLWVFGTKTIALWRNAGATNFPFQRVDGGVIERGCFGARTIVGDEGAVYFVADDRTVRRIAGTTAERVSTHALERVLHEYTNGDDIVAMTWAEAGHKMYGLRFPDRPAWVYDMTVQAWHERSSDYFGVAAWSAHSSERAFGYELIGGADGKIYRLDPAVNMEFGTTIARMGESAPIVRGDDRTILKRVSLNLKTGYANLGREPQVALQISRDGRLYTPEKWRPMSSLGDYSRVVSWHGLGQARRHQIRWKITDDINVALYGATYDLLGPDRSERFPGATSPQAQATG